MSDIFREVDEELRQDQFKTLWKKYGWMIIAVVVIAIGGVGGKQAWDAYQQDKAYQLSDRYASAMQAVETADLERAQDLSLSGEKLFVAALFGDAPSTQNH